VENIARTTLTGFKYKSAVEIKLVDNSNSEKKMPRKIPLAFPAL